MACQKKTELRLVSDFGISNFKNPKIWNTLPQDAKALSISETQLETILSPYLPTILKEQAKREKK